MLEKKISSFIRNRLFVTLGTASPEASPHVSPKLFLKMKGKYIYLIDYLIGVSFKNIRNNSKVSISTFDIPDVKGYHIYGKASILNSGPEYEVLLSEWNDKQTKISAKKVSQTVSGRKNGK